MDTAERPAVADRPEHPGWASIPDEPEADEVIIRRNGRISVVLAGVSALLSAAYFARAVTEFDHVLDWVLCLALAGLTWAHIFSFLDSRMPLLVADSHGVRIRLGRTWRGMAWTDLEEVEYAARRHVVRDGRLVLFPRELEGELAMLGPAGRRHARLTAADARRAVRDAARPHHPGARRRRRPERRAGPPGRRPLRDRRGRSRGRRRLSMTPAARRPLRLLRARRRRRGAVLDARARCRRSPRRCADPTPSRRVDRELGARGHPVHRAPGHPQRHHDVRHRRPGRARGGRPGDRPPAGGRPRTAAALGRPARRPDPDPPARHRGDRDRRLRAVRRRLLCARPPAHPGPGARRRRGAAAGDLRRQVRRRADRPAPGLRGRARDRPRRPDPRHPRRPELVGDRRRRDDRRAGLVGGPAGDGPARPRPRRRRRAWPTGRPG